VAKLELQKAEAKRLNKTIRVELRFICFQLGLRFRIILRGVFNTFTTVTLRKHNTAITILQP